MTLASSYKPLRPEPTKEEIDALVVQYLPLVKYVVGRLTIPVPSYLDKEDLVEIGVFGLIKAARSFDAAKGATFKTYAYTNIKGAIYDELRRIDIVPRKQRDRLREVETAREQLSAELSRQPTLGEIADRLQLPVTELDELLVTQRSCQLLSLDVDGPEQRSLLDTVESQDRGPLAQIEREELIHLLAQGIGELPRTEQTVLILYYKEGLFLKEIGALLEVSESRVSQLLSRAVQMLNIWLTDKTK